MAGHNIEFSIGSKYQGEGFKKAEQAIKDNAREVQSFKTGLGELKTSFANISPAAATAVGGIQKFVGAFKEGGIVGGIIATAMTGLGFAIEKVTEKLNEAKERSAAFADVLRSEIVGAIDTAKSKFADLKSDIADANDALADTLNLANGEVTAKASSQINEIRLQLAESLAGLSDEAKATATALAEQKIAAIKHNAEQEKAANTLNAYSEMVNSSKAKVAAAEDQKAAALAQVAAMEKQHAPYLTERQRILNYITSTEQRLAAGELSQAQALPMLRDARIALANLEKENATAVQDLKRANDAVTAANKDIETAKKEERKASIKETEAQQKLTQVKEEGAVSLQENINKVNDAREKEQAAINAAAAAEQQAADELKEIIRKGKEKADEAFAGLTIEEFINEYDEDAKKEGGKNKGKKEKANANANANAEANVDNEGIINAINNPKQIVQAQVIPLKEALAKQREEARATRDRLTEIRGEFGTEFANYFQALSTNANTRSEKQNELIKHMEENVIPGLANELGPKVAAKFLSGESRRVLMPNDLREWWGPNGPLIKELEKLVVK